MATFRIIKLMIKEKMPKVKKIKGAKKNFRIGFSKRFKRVKDKVRIKNCFIVPVK